MKKTIAVLLLLAAGVGIFYVLRNKQTYTDKKLSINELTTGSWKMDTIILSSKDSNSLIGQWVQSELQKLHYSFKNDSTILLTSGDSIIQNTSRYYWKDKSTLIYQDDPEDLPGSVFQVKTLTKDSLNLLQNDSTTIIFTRSE